MTHLSADELAARWHVTRGHLANLRSAGDGPPYVKIGGRVLYPFADIDAYEAARRIVPARYRPGLDDTQEVYNVGE